jgi:UDP-N-acetyl-2-amino-2-deoxyglucuronate dehydrogenase
MAEPIRFALVGAGMVAGHHVNALKEIPDVELIGVCRRNPQKAKAFAETHGLAWTTDYNNFLRDPNVDIVDIVTPQSSHAEIGIAAARAGKHVVVEKPIAADLTKADQLIDTCKKEGVTLSVISQNRFTDAIQELRAAIIAGTFGKILEGDAYVKWLRPQSYYDQDAWRGTMDEEGGGVLINQAIHFIDVLLWIMGPVKNVYAYTKTVAHDMETEDLAAAMVNFESGALGVIQGSTAMYPGLPARLEIHGTKGTAILEGTEISFWQVEDAEPRGKKETEASGASTPMDISIEPFVRQFKDIIAAIREGRQPLVTGEEARKPLALIKAIYKSAKDKGLVELL